MTALIDLYTCDHASLVAWVCKTYGLTTSTTQAHNVHRLRRESIARRLRLYRDQAFQDVAQIIDQVYETEDYRRTLKRYINVALEQNVIRRIVDEIASLYDRPVLRVLQPPEQDAQFHLEEKRINLHEIAQEGHRLTTLCNETLEWWVTGADDKYKIRLITPDLFDAIPHPKDNLTAAGFLIDTCPTTVLEGHYRQRLPHWELWDDTYRYYINGYGVMVDAGGAFVVEPEKHGFGRIPGVLMHRREPTTVILDSAHGSDIVSAHLGVALLNVMIMRLSKSQGENQPVLQGNLAGVAAGQTMNGEKPLLLPPEVVASMLNMKTDPDHYITVKRDKITSVAQTYGMSYEQFTNTETGDSGKLYEMRREKLKEIRNESRRRAVMNEAQTVTLMGFDPTGMRLDYQEQSLPQDAGEKLALLKDKMKLGLDSAIAYMQREDPDLSRADAIAMLQSNLRDYGILIEWVRALNVPMGADAANPGQSPQVNGAQNQPKTQDAPPDTTAEYT